MTAYNKLNFYERVMSRHAELVQDKQIWVPQLQSIVEHFRPDLTISSKNSADGAFLHDNIVEGTGPWAAGVMARGFTGATVGRTLKWIRHQMGQMKFRGHDELNAWLQRVDDYLREQVYGQSNFYEIIR